MYEWTQDRTFIITSDKIYNLKKLKIKRAIPISKLGGLSKSIQGPRAEFTLHIPSEYDYRYISEK